MLNQAERSMIINPVVSRQPVLLPGKGVGCDLEFTQDGSSLRQQKHPPNLDLPSLIGWDESDSAPA